MADTPAETTQQQADELTFEQAMQQLEQIVAQLEQGDMPLEGALQQFERAIALSRVSQKKLQQAEQKVSLLLQQQQGETLEPFAESSRSSQEDDV
ncbi:exodeoxyribonuclease VII small subunit [Pseudidiomarina aestuarii]|uniref:Exodeoxyribonuclease 7 small subunit n=1 Tax=Pseudidiomarina aestuarii TaxID=624146 RepID=A0A2T4CN26_9GAMM|nr:exodeoxyribonuclease VII small subunit [Pseudidiomarina aestuarii]PTB85110.1 exodeoxyribonuclease VII small subunit [Pseudidiomarina aestuarii]PTB89617.1 exodeoxyribonuclease VII small subunit [Pseudidiomarina aestuarii]